MLSQRSQPSSNVGSSDLDLLDLCQQLIQIRSDDGFAHQMDQVLRQALQGFGRELGHFFRRTGRRLGVEELDPEVGLNFSEQLRLMEWLADKIVGADPQ